MLIDGWSQWRKGKRNRAIDTSFLNNLCRPVWNWLPSIISNFQMKEPGTRIRVVLMTLRLFTELDESGLGDKVTYFGRTFIVQDFCNRTRNFQWHAYVRDQTLAYQELQRVEMRGSVTPMCSLHRGRNPLEISEPKSLNPMRLKPFNKGTHS